MSSKKKKQAQQKLQAMFQTYPWLAQAMIDMGDQVLIPSPAQRKARPTKRRTSSQIKSRARMLRGFAQPSAVSQPVKRRTPRGFGQPSAIAHPVKFPSRQQS